MELARTLFIYLHPLSRGAMFQGIHHPQEPRAMMPTGWQHAIHACHLDANNHASLAGGTYEAVAYVWDARK